MFKIVNTKNNTSQNESICLKLCKYLLFYNILISWEIMLLNIMRSYYMYFVDKIQQFFLVDKQFFLKTQSSTSLD